MLPLLEVKHEEPSGRVSPKESWARNASTLLQSVSSFHSLQEGPPQVMLYHRYVRNALTLGKWVTGHVACGRIDTLRYSFEAANPADRVGSAWGTGAVKHRSHP